MIELRHLTKQYGTTTVVDTFSFQVRPGTITGFLGPNVLGSGRRAVPPTWGFGW